MKVAMEDGRTLLERVFDYSFPILDPLGTLFLGPFKECQWIAKDIKYVGHEETFVTYFDSTRNTMLNDSSLTLWDMFHRYCYFFAIYFLQNNSNWNFCAIKTGDGELIHAFCYYIGSDYTLFADARGITNSPVHFFADFFFEEPERCKAYYSDPDEEIYDEDVYNAIVSAYRLTYGAIDANNLSEVFDVLYDV